MTDQTTQTTLTRADVTRVLRLLRQYGWKHTTNPQPGSRDFYGAPDGPDLIRHTWTRNGQLIETWFNCDDSRWFGHVNFMADATSDSLYGINEEWLANMTGDQVVSLLVGAGVLPTSAQVTELRAEVKRLTGQLAKAKSDGQMYQDRYWAVQEVLDVALGPNEEDGSGEGMAADVHLLAQQREEARAEAEQLRGVVGALRVTVREMLAAFDEVEPYVRASTVEKAAMWRRTLELSELPASEVETPAPQPQRTCSCKIQPFVTPPRVVHLSTCELRTEAPAVETPAPVGPIESVCGTCVDIRTALDGAA